MKNGYLKIKVLYIDDGDSLFQYQICLSNGQTTSSLDFWGYENEFKAFSAKLIDFPKDIKEKVRYELGKDNDDHLAYYLFLEVFCYELSGHSTLKIIIDNRLNEPDYNRCEFFIKSIPASINEFGKALYNWNPAMNIKFEWEFED